MVGASWQQNAEDRLVTLQQEGGGWSYRARGTACAEATSLACIALSRAPACRSAVDRGLGWLAAHQRPDGGVPITAEIKSPCWPTGLAVLAWLHPPAAGATEFTHNIERAVSWLCKTAGLPIPDHAGVLGHDTKLIGWPWVQGTHSWLEPTAYAVWALRQAGLAQHRRTRDGVAVLLDRVVEGGGWNYGNPRVFDNALRPFPGTTGLVLRALAGEPAEDAVSISTKYLVKELETVRAPMTLGWGLIGLAAWDACPADSDRWLRESAERMYLDEASPVYDALLLMASHALSQCALR